MRLGTNILVLFFKVGAIWAQSLHSYIQYSFSYFHKEEDFN